MKQIFVTILAMPILVLLSYAAVKIGVIGGTLLFDISMEGGVVEGVDTESFKIALSKSLPLINTVYNSGSMSTSFIGELRNLVERVSGFDLGNPLTILNAQSPYFYVYYNKSYLPMQAKLEQEKRETLRDAEDENAQNVPEYGEIHKLPEDSSLPPEGQKPGDTDDDGVKPGVASSITYEGETEEKDFSKENSVSYDKIAVQNETKFKITENDIAKLLKEPLKFKFDRKGPKVFIYHTHTTESYIKNLADLNKKDVPSWSRDARYNVVRVGNELAQHLKKAGIETIHSGMVHDYPNYNLSYANSLNTLEKYLKSYPSIKITFDIHRDGLGSAGKKLRVYTKVNGKNAAKVMFVVGTNQKLEHPDWKENLKLALKLQEKLNKLCPGLAKPIYISENRYNQHLTKGSLIVEIGGDGNTLEEAMESAKYLAVAVKEVIK